MQVKLSDNQYSKTSTLLLQLSFTGHIIRVTSSSGISLVMYDNYDLIFEQSHLHNVGGPPNEMVVLDVFGQLIIKKEIFTLSVDFEKHITY